MIRLVLLALLQGAATAPQIPVQMGVAVRPDTVTVGEHFQAVVRVRAPAGASIAFPPGADSGGTVESVDPRTVRGTGTLEYSEQTATYRLVAWDTGAVAAQLGDIVVSTGGAVRRVPLRDVRVYVRSVLPADTALRVPKPARDILVGGRPWWHWLIAALVALALLALLFWWWRRRRRPGAALPTDPLAEAEREFARIDALGLLEAGERGRYVALNVEVLRDYLAARVPAAARSLTSTELLDALRAEPRVPSARLAPVLSEADLIKFARRPVTSERARQLAHETRAIVRDVESAISTPPAQEAA